MLLLGCVGVGGVGGMFTFLELAHVVDATPWLTFVALAHISMIRHFEVV